MSGALPNRTSISLGSQPRYIYTAIYPRDGKAHSIGVARSVYSRLEYHVEGVSGT